ncbi:MAG: class I SAM-dependent methyltransferase [Actinomycetes bacterium]
MAGPSEKDVTPGGEQYFTASPRATSRPGTVDLVLDGRTLPLRTDRGVFSADRLDPGTRVLLETLPPFGALPEGALADVGCGYGPIALTLAARHPDRTVVAVDVNERARALCAENARTAGLAVDVRAADDVPAGLRLAAMVSNPPIRVGKAVLHELLSEWLGRLVEGGEAWLVVQRHLGADSLADWVGAQGWTVEKVRSKKGYRVLCVRRPPPPPAPPDS